MGGAEPLHALEVWVLVQYERTPKAGRCVVLPLIWYIVKWGVGTKDGSARPETWPLAD